MIQSPVYISGPMTGIPDYNRPAFNAAAAKLRGLGFEVVNPAEQPERPTWEEYMRHDIKLMMDCRSIVLLPGWESSKGARVEYQIAESLRFYIVRIEELDLVEIEERVRSLKARRGDFLAMADYVDQVRGEYHARG